MFVHDPEDKQFYCENSIHDEKILVDIMKSKGIDAEINPEKLPPHNNKYALDLIVNGIKCEAKVQYTPFYYSFKKFGILPKYCYSFGSREYDKYPKKYGLDLNIFILFDLTKADPWFNNKFFDISHKGIYLTKMKHIINYVQNYNVKRYEYINRINDKNGNDKYGYHLDISNSSYFKLIIDQF